MQKISLDLIKFDVHTHRLTKVSDPNAVLNVFWQDIESLPEGQSFSVSVHPWYLDSFNQELYDRMIQNISDNPYFVALGECGLDKNTAFNPDFQISVLNQQYKLAERLNKPMIIHCVQSFDLLLEWKKGKSVNMLLHGFNRKLPLLKDLLKSGFYVSFGAALCENRPFVSESFENCPLDRIFLETDNQTDYDINAIYESAAAIKGISTELLTLEISENRNQFFKNF